MQSKPSIARAPAGSGYGWARGLARRARRARPFDGQGRWRWLFPVLALAGPLAGEAAGEFLPGCLLFGAVVGLWRAHRTGAVWSVLVWCVVTGGFATALVLVEVPDIPLFLLPLGACVTAVLQAFALLMIGAPATIAGWSARGMLLAALAGPAALALLAVDGVPAWEAIAPSLAVSLNLAALPLALLARRRAGASIVRP
ncbi:hypothetical protein [Caulobacter sp. 1776]|uniref:hypothetical protein n=1 Tax=Caulobacter sp. 1776 TaxID=3156420 RepID=UPI003399E006